MVQAQQSALNPSAPNCAQLLEELVTHSKTEEGRADFIASGLLRVACSRLSAFVTAWRTDPTEGAQKLLLLLRLLRNTCAAGMPAASALCSAHVMTHIPQLARQLVSYSESQPVPHQGRQLLATLVQFVANFATAARDEQQPDSFWGLGQMSLQAGPQESLWMSCFPTTFLLITASSAANDQVLNPLTTAIHACCRSCAPRAAQLCSPAGATLLRGLIKALLPEGDVDSDPLAREGQLSGRGNEWLQMLLVCLCFQHGLLRELLTALEDPSAAANDQTAASTSTSSTASHQLWRWSRFQAAALHLIAADIGVAGGAAAGPPPDEQAGVSAAQSGSGSASETNTEAPAEQGGNGDAQSGVGESDAAIAEGDGGGAEVGGWERSLGVLMEVVEAAAGSSGEAGSRVLEAALEVLRSVGQRDDSGAALCGGVDAVEALTRMGLLKRMLAMLKALRPVENPRKAGQQQPDLPQAELAPALREEAARYPADAPYPGYRSDLLAIIANAVHRRSKAQDLVLQVGGVELVLAQCQVDDQSPLAREWALWAVRNLCEGNAAVQQAVAGLQVCTTLETPELQKLGLRLELDKDSGKMRVVRQEDSEGSGRVVVTEEGS